MNSINNTKPIEIVKLKHLVDQAIALVGQTNKHLIMTHLLSGGTSPENYLKALEVCLSRGVSVSRICFGDRGDYENFLKKSDPRIEHCLCQNVNLYQRMLVADDKIAMFRLGRIGVFCKSANKLVVRAYRDYYGEIEEVVKKMGNNYD